MEEKDKWFVTDKATLNTNFANLPNLKVGDFHVCETVAISTYILYKFNLTALIGGDL